MEMGGNIKNPFLFDDPTANSDDVGVGNPFLDGSPFEISAATYTGINPFSDVIDDSSDVMAAMNLFGGGPAAYAPEMNPFGSATAGMENIFDVQPQVTAMSGTAPVYDIFGSLSTEPEQPPIAAVFGGPVLHEPPKPPPRPPSPATSPVGTESTIPGRPPPPRPPPPSKETKDLLQTVIGAMEATTDTLQDKLNTTKTPCQSPAGGTHTSRSPTPDIQITAPDKEPDAFSTIFGQTIELSDQEIDETHSSVPVTSSTDVVTQSTPSDTSDLTQQTVKTDDIDLFGESVIHSKPKTTQDILSLFGKPQETPRQQIDLLSDDLLTGNEQPEVKGEDIKPESPPSTAPESSLPPDDLSATAGGVVSDLNDIIAPSDEQKGKATETPPESILDRQSPDLVGSPDQLSEKSDSEPTVIESETKRKSHMPPETEEKSEFPAAPAASPADSETLQNADLQKLPEQGVNYDTAELPDIANQEETIESTKDRSSPLPTAELDEFVSNIFGLPEASEPQIIELTEPDQNYEATVLAANVFEDEGFPATTTELPIDADQIFGAPLDAEPREEEVIPSEEISFTATAAVNEISSQESESAFPPPPAALFGDVSAEDSVPLPPPPEALFGDINTDNSAPLPPPPVEASTGFDIFGFGEPIPTPIPSGAESTGAALFETTPAPNVGMGLFGAGDEATLDIFAESECNVMVNPFAPTSQAPSGISSLGQTTAKDTKLANEEEFDAFSARFENVSATETIDNTFDPFTANRAASPWGETATSEGAPTDDFGFGDNAQFDAFLALTEPPPVPQSTPRKAKRETSQESDEVPMNVIIKPTAFDQHAASPASHSPVPILAPPPASLGTAFIDSTSRFNPFDKSAEELSESVTAGVTAFPGEKELKRTESQETPPTPLFEEDQSVPLEPMPRISYDGRTWEMHLRQPNKKKITGQRFWKKVFVKFADAGALQLFNNLDDKEPFQELPLQPCYSISDIGAQQFDQFGKIFTVKVQYIFYKERPGVRPGQISKAERITNKLSKFAQYAIAGDYEGVKEFASDVRKLGMPVEHAPQISQLLKLGTQNYEDLKLFASIMEEFMFKLTVHRDRALTYKTEEVQLTAVDEMYVEHDTRGVVSHMVARVRIFFLGFLTGMPEVDLGINDLRKQGREVVGRHDIIPVITEEWIRLEDIEFHCTVDQEEFEKTRHIKFKPPDACYIELMRFRVRPPKNRELPLQVKTKFIIQGKRVEIQCEILVPGFSGRKLGQVPCEDVAVRFPLPECWIYMFRVEKHFRYGSVKSAHRRTGKVKGIERFKGTMESAESALMEVTSGQAKYEHQHRAVVWRMSRLPKEGQGAYTTHQFSCRMNLTAYDQIPQELDRYCILEFTMPATTVSHCVMRSISVTSEDPPEKYVRYLARHEYKMEIEFSSGSGPNEYIAVTMKDPTAKDDKKEHTPAVQEESSSDESS